MLFWLVLWYICTDITLSAISVLDYVWGCWDGGGFVREVVVQGDRGA